MSGDNYQMQNFPWTCDIDIFWHELLRNSSEEEFIKFKNLAAFVLKVLSIPHANADCERVFSKINLVKTKTRNRLILPTVTGILFSSQRVQKDYVKYNPTVEYNRMTKAVLYQEKEEVDLEEVVTLPN